MLTLTFLNARHGDACLVNWSDGDHRRTMLVDGGPADTHEQEIVPTTVDAVLSHPAAVDCSRQRAAHPRRTRLRC